MVREGKSKRILSDFYGQGFWRKKREYILARDSYLCRECSRYGRTVQAQTVHHIKPLEDFVLQLINREISFEKFYALALEDENLVSLCHRCHNKKHPEKGGKHR